MATPLQARTARWLVANQLWLSLLLLFAWIEETAWRLQGDASYDLLNYHLYGPFALLHGKWGIDVAPAQGQGFLPPTIDIPFYLLARYLDDVHLLNLLLALPAAVAIGLAFLITLHLLRATSVIERLIALATVVISATGAATHPLLATSMSVFFLASYALWERQFSILRYLSVLESFSATMTAMLAFEVAQTVRARRALLACSVLLLVARRLYTVYPNWGRMSEQGGKPLEIDIPALPPDSLVLLLDNAPLSYLALFEPDSVRFLGPNNNIVQLHQGRPLQRTIRAAIAAQPANLYGLEKPDFDKGSADRTLAAYGLHRVGCDEVTGRIVGTTTWLCRLAKATPP